MVVMVVVTVAMFVVRVVSLHWCDCSRWQMVVVADGGCGGDNRPDGCVDSGRSV